MVVDLSMNKGFVESGSIFGQVGVAVNHSAGIHSTCHAPATQSLFHAQNIRVQSRLDVYGVCVAQTGRWLLGLRSCSIESYILLLTCKIQGLTPRDKEQIQQQQQKKEDCLKLEWSGQQNL